MSTDAQDQATAVYYPETDGKPMGETELHVQLITDLRFALREFFRDRKDIHVGSNLLLYYEEGNPRKFIVPDVFVARVRKTPPRRVYKMWEEGRAPSVVIEVSSRETWLADVQRKWQLYERLGVSEYFIFDPEYSYQEQPLLAYRLQEGQLLQLEVIGGRISSEELGLELVDTGETLRLFNPATNQFLMTQDEMTDALQAEAEARRQAEDEVARLRDEIERLRGGAE
ncbi:MAG: Uma2 family endonuclease [Acidobacteriota bacterium]